MTLAKKTLDYYFNNIESLPDDKAFHFATRIAAWTGDNRAHEQLRASQHALVPLITDNIPSMLNDLISNPPKAKINAAAARQPYFDKYPKLRGFDFALFRLRHMLHVYNIDGRTKAFTADQEIELERLRNMLLSDTEALKILSTYAINYLYLLWHLYDYPEPDVELLYEIGKTYSTHSAESAQLKIYFYTHCIIGATNFYIQPISQNKDVYIAMLDDLELLISEAYSDINLDCKMEFLVSNRICNRQTFLFDKIQKEAERSFSPEGDFIIDTHNNWTNLKMKTSFADSEHRNVLYIMSQTQFQPHETLLKS